MKINKKDKISGKITESNFQVFDPSICRKSFLDFFLKKEDGDFNINKKLEYARHLKQQMKEFREKTKKLKLEEVEYENLLKSKIDKDINRQYKRFVNESNFDTPIKPFKGDIEIEKITKFEDTLNKQNSNSKGEKKERNNLDFSNYSIISKTNNKGETFLNESCLYHLDNQEIREKIKDRVIKNILSTEKMEISNPKMDMDLKLIEKNDIISKLIKNEDKQNMQTFNKENKSNLKFEKYFPLNNRYDILDNLKKSNFQIGENRINSLKDNSNFGVNKIFQTNNAKLNGEDYKKNQIINEICKSLKSKKFDCSEILSQIESFSGNSNKLKILSQYN